MSKRKRKSRRSTVKAQGKNKIGNPTAIIPCSPPAEQSTPSKSHSTLTAERILYRYPRLERRFYEPLVLLSILDPVRGCHFNNSLRGTDDTLDQLRRSFVDAIATICDSRKGGDTVTAVALQATPLNTVIWLAANEKPTTRTAQYLQRIISALGKVTPHKRALVTEEVSDRVVEFCRSSSVKEIMSVCMKCRIHFPTLSGLSRRETDQHQPVTRTKHFIGRLAIYQKSIQTLLDVALDIPQLLENCQLRICESSRHLPSPLNPKASTLDGVVHRMFPEFTSTEVRRDLERLNIFGNLHEQLSRACTFKTRVHAELLLIEKSRSNGWEFVAGDKYIGCSKPACFCCYHYINSLPERYSISGCHNKIYTHWRAPDLTIQDLKAAKIREDALNAVVAKLRTEVRRCIDERPVKIRPHYDSITGSTSVARPEEIEGGDCIENDIEIEQAKEAERQREAENQREADDWGPFTAKKRKGRKRNRIRSPAVEEAPEEVPPEEVPPEEVPPEEVPPEEVPPEEAPPEEAPPGEALPDE
ncbi:hypothetical protein BGW36DRAFT_286171 [Talaromyces proteolyticus]|uniref:Uncharacterized protein n=1 Tax=Talaromyces proteolyticus TaxID=1131652 RepID=A0AAD4L3T3_9EURO|nr:uncharacterized protein BGW36DRAFT_286171 [Talaromyces proteolyticus]KAH8706056.1 hypothetical protein BGW36DRAFT_286171 [Talaromyces proteolyticus]